MRLGRKLLVLAALAALTTFMVGTGSSSGGTGPPIPPTNCVWSVTKTASLPSDPNTNITSLNLVTGQTVTVNYKIFVTRDCPAGFNPNDEGGTAHVIDSFAGQLGPFHLFRDDTSTHAEATFMYPRDITATSCQPFAVTNNVLIVDGNPDKPFASDSLTINVRNVSAECGKTFTIGPSSMEGNLWINAGDFFNGGYSFKFKNSSHPATQYTVTAKVEVPVTCPKGGGAGGTILIDLGTVIYNVPAGNTSWLPTGDANSILSWQGVTVTPNLCNGFPMNNSKGAIFTATVLQNPPTGSLVDFRFKYRDPAAKGKPNTNCTDASDPNRNRADVCGASWSQTVTDP